MTSPGTIRPFRLEIAQSEVDDLHDRLARSRWPQGPVDETWSRGVPADYLRTLAEHWRSGFDWSAMQERINAVPQLITAVGGQDLHLLHLRSPETDALPLILSHGWPGSVVEFLDVLGPLTDPAAHGGDPADAFHVVAPSLPGFGFSPPLHEHGWDATRMARAFAEVMRRLGYDRYGAQGGDVGSAVAGELALHDAEHVVGYHVNTDLLAAGAVASFGGQALDPAAFPDEEQAAVERVQRFVADGLGYLALQCSRPRTVGYALNDSPVGQLAWIVEKFREWTNPTIELPEDAVDLDLLLANVSAYWYSGSGAASAHFLYDAFHYERDWGAKPTVPRGWSIFGGDGSVIRRLSDPQHEIEYWTEHKEGGHFAALEAPDLFVEDLRGFFRSLR